MLSRPLHSHPHVPGLAALACALAFVSPIDAEARKSPAPAPARISLLGWSLDGRLVAWRESGRNGKDGVRVAAVSPEGHLGKARALKGDATEALRRRDIWAFTSLATDVVEADRLFRTSNGATFAAACRKGVLGILERRGEDYEPVFRRPVAAVRLLDVEAYESPSGSLVAVVLHVEDDGGRRASYLAVVRVPEHRRPFERGWPEIRRPAEQLASPPPEGAR